MCSLVCQASPCWTPICPVKRSQSCAVSLPGVSLREQCLKGWVTLHLWSWGKRIMCCVLNFPFWAKYEKWWEILKDQLLIGLQSASLFSGNSLSTGGHAHGMELIEWPTLPPSTYLVLRSEEERSLPKLKLYTLQFVKHFHKLWCHFIYKGVTEQKDPLPSIFRGPRFSKTLRSQAGHLDGIQA